ncbi:MAG: 3-hydroxybutyryl-CoA dehydrogenase [Deltaproteobacteria bacterium]|nr:MAG: 3-hydroxybutyryl-CoA dehydrogenase [Deltaproteobacteria bacterium]
MTVKRLGIVGAGQMGSGIAQVAATSGIEVILVDLSDEVLDRARKGIEKRLARAVEKGRHSPEEKEAALGRIQTAVARHALAECDFVVEAVVENEAVKKEIFADLDRICRKDAILASNTSSISITRLAAATRRPGQVIGMHFMNPVPVMKLVEVIRGIATTDETHAATRALAETMGKTCVDAKDYPGFIINRILLPMINEAFYALMEGVASAEDIDAGMKLGTNQPMGPLTLADFIGLDTCLSIMEVLHEGLGDAKYRPCPLLRQYVDAGWLGRKTGRGVYTYDAQ